MSDELLQNVVDILDNAHSQKVQLVELLSSLEESKNQVKQSAQESRCTIKEHFTKLKKCVVAALDSRLDTLLKNVDNIEEVAMSPLCQCEDMINQGIAAASKVMEDGKSILSTDPENNLDGLMRFKINADSKNLDSVPEVPCLSDVPYISTEFSSGLLERLSEIIAEEGKTHERAPVHITDIEEGPGSLLLKWTEVDDEVEVCDFWLQYCYGSCKSNKDKSFTFHQVYTGPSTTFRIKQLRINSPYSFRVCCRTDSSSNWSSWSIPKVAMTTMPQYQWSTNIDGYCTSIDDTISTRLDTEDTFIHYSKNTIYNTGYPITFKVLAAGEGSPMDGIGFSVDSTDTFTLIRKNAIFVNSSGAIFVDGNEMKTKLPPLVRGSVITFETEVLPNGKIRVTAEVKEKEMTFDWTIESPMAASVGMFPSSGQTRSFYFGARFSHQDWKISVE